VLFFYSIPEPFPIPIQIRFIPPKNSTPVCFLNFSSCFKVLHNFNFFLRGKFFHLTIASPGQSTSSRQVPQFVHLSCRIKHCPYLPPCNIITAIASFGQYSIHCPHAIQSLVIFILLLLSFNFSVVKTFYPRNRNRVMCFYLF